MPPHDRLPGTGAVLVSACLAGCRCRFDGSGARHPVVEDLVASGRAVLVCPEEDGGLPTPRPPAEIAGGSGDDVLDGRAQVVTRQGNDVTDAYLRGAEAAVAAARATGASAAVLKARSPSCGKGAIYDGSFARTLRAGDGVTAAALRRAGVDVVADDELRTRGVQDRLA